MQNLLGSLSTHLSLLHHMLTLASQIASCYKKLIKHKVTVWVSKVEFILH